MLFKLDQRKQLRNSFLDRFALVLAYAQPVTDVFLHGHLRKERVRLKDHSYAAFASRELGHILAVQNHLAGVWLFESGDNSQDCCLPASGRTEQNKSFAFGDVKGNIFEHTGFAKPFANPNNAGSGRLDALLQARMHHILSCHCRLSLHSFLKSSANWAGTAGGSRIDQSTSSQSRAKKSTLKIRNENNASTTAIALAASICPSLNLAKI